MASDITQAWVDLAIDMITKYGRTENITFTRATYGSYSSSTLDRTPTAAITYICKAAIVDFAINSKFGSNVEAANTTIVTGQTQMYIPGVDVDGVVVSPQVGDTLNYGTGYRIIEVVNYQTLSVACAYLLRVGR